MVESAPGHVLDDMRITAPEDRLLVALCALHATDEQSERVRAFVHDHGRTIDWDGLLAQASRHGVVPIIGRAVRTLRLGGLAQAHPSAPRWWLYTYAYLGNRRRNTALAVRFAEVMSALTDAGLDYAIRKGPLLVEGVYADPGLRRMGDLDVALRREDMAAFDDVARRLGFAQGKPSADGTRIVPFDRETRLFWAMNLNNALPYMSLAEEDEVGVYVLDPCFSLFQHLSGIDVPIEVFLERARPAMACGVRTRALRPVDQVIDLCVHFHKEAVSVNYVEIGADLTLLKLLDVAETLRTAPDEVVAALPATAAEYGCVDSVHYALHHTALLFPDAVPDDLLAATAPEDLGYLDEYGALDGRVERWPIGFFDRMFRRDRSSLLAYSSTVPF